MLYLDYMVDVETTGLTFGSAAVLQIAAGRFSLHHREVDPGPIFCRSLMMPTNRVWEQGTALFWESRKELFDRITREAVPPYQAIAEFINWVNTDGGIPDARRFFCNNNAFDWHHLHSYLTEYKLESPFRYFSVRDIRSFGEGQMFPQRTLPKRDPSFAHGFEVHDARADVIIQIQWLFEMVKGVKIPCED